MAEAGPLVGRVGVIGCYDLHLYCSFENPEHEYGEFPQYYTDEFGYRCRARRHGWKLFKDGRAMCPKMHEEKEVTTTKPQSTTEPKLTMTADELFERHPLPWSHHLLLIKDANGNQVIHTGGLYSERGRQHEGKYLSGLNALLVELVNIRTSPASAAPVGDDLYAVINRVAKEPCRDYVP